jgi:hypothetical protein
MFVETPPELVREERGDISPCYKHTAPLELKFICTSGKFFLEHTQFHNF